MTPGLLTPEALSEKPEPPDQKVNKKAKNYSGAYKYHILLQSSEADTVTPAQFDWNKSGLTDPLSENGNN